MLCTKRTVCPNEMGFSNLFKDVKGPNISPVYCQNVLKIQREISLLVWLIRDGIIDIRNLNSAPQMGRTLVGKINSMVGR